jgi:uncharacterized cupin superfamily protein
MDQMMQVGISPSEPRHRIIVGVRYAHPNLQQGRGKRMTKPIINVADVELQPRPAVFAPKSPTTAEKFDARVGFVAPRVGAQKLGYNITAVPPGKCAFPFHNHRVNEEMFFILEGTGEVRMGPGRYPVKSGDIIACPPGGPETAHQLVNTSKIAELKYLAVSTKLTPEVCDYPDSGKFAVLAEYPADKDGKVQTFRFVSRADKSLDYWEGE